MLRFEGIVKRYGRAKALDEVSLHLAGGEVVLLTGANGAGKTTLLRMAATLDRPQAGHVRIAGIDPRDDGAAARARIGFVSHDPGLYDELTLRENLLFFAGFHLNTRAAEDAVDAALEIVGLTDVRDRKARAVSRGMKQRAAIARAIAHRPDLLLMDEPDAALDADSRQRLGAAMARAADDGAAILFSSHDPDRWRAAVTREITLERGRIVAPAAHEPEAGP